MEQSGRVALVAGASAGFGRETALELVRRGYQVFGGFRGTLGGFDERSAALRDAAGIVGGNIESVSLDVTDDASVARVVQGVLGRAGRIDALINVAGIGVHGPWPSIDVAAFRQQLETNLVGMYRMCLAVEPAMREQGGGYIVNVSSDAGIRAAFWEVAYSASKYGVEGMSFGMRLESQQFGIRVCVVEPGWYTDTEYEQRMVSTVDWDSPAGPYADLVRTMMENQPKVETGKPGARAVGIRIADILEEDDPPFQNPVGASAIRTASYPNWEQYEQRVFEFYSLERFRGPWTRHTQPA
jgi:NAD(P)-dependent dehydrogenase (short-subunit alcohol dehydrogenase family)